MIHVSILTATQKHEFRLKENPEPQILVKDGGVIAIYGQDVDRDAEVKIFSRDTVIIKRAP